MEKNKIDDVLLPIAPMEQAKRENRVREQFWPKFRRFAAQLPFAEDVAAAWFCAMDSSTPIRVRGTLLGALAYFILPLDMVPDILAVVGFTDDIAVLTAAFTLVSSHINEEHRAKARRAMEDARAEDVSEQ